MKDLHSEFYENLPLLRDFTLVADPARFSAVPDDWVLGVADIVDSTGEIARGRYKTVNTVGAAVISAMINAMDGKLFPYVFGGDGAGFAVPPSQVDAARDALAALRRWAEEEFSMPLRAALVSVADIRAAGRDLRVARYAPSTGVDYAMFSGGGLAWAEAEMKAGRNMVERAEPGVQPDLTGLSCRWSNSMARHGQIVSLVVEPTASATERDFADLAQSVLSMSEQLERAGHPVPENGPPMKWPPPGLEIDAHVSRNGRNMMLQKIVLLFQNLLIAILFKSGKRMGQFEPDHYKHMVSSNADFRKFDDGLKMTLDCDPSTLKRIEQMLEEARARGKIKYGLHAQDEAMMTCIVPSATRDDHMHFVDGASGGYAQAAAAMRA
ncbi:MULTISPECIES: DUF3095 domain-containing protein [unclassified Ruegeria]|uniref:DUF3095 domain-containing protein n=1 Tax=unclassified Ruegeria TaxID=2625375 RepID=UPI0014876DA5|nr:MULTISPECIES: DUF3095 domain-containing protein [unclassified Ruegeria]NOD64925.1 DUF3095 family protein [Ruegeria sp. HKCCD6109]